MWFFVVRPRRTKAADEKRQRDEKTQKGQNDAAVKKAAEEEIDKTEYDDWVVRTLPDFIRKQLPKHK